MLKSSSATHNWCFCSPADGHWLPDPAGTRWFDWSTSRSASGHWLLCYAGARGFSGSKYSSVPRLRLSTPALTLASRHDGGATCSWLLRKVDWPIDEDGPPRNNSQDRPDPGEDDGSQWHNVTMGDTAPAPEGGDCRTALDATQRCHGNGGGR